MITCARLQIELQVSIIIILLFTSLVCLGFVSVGFKVHVKHRLDGKLHGQRNNNKKYISKENILVLEICFAQWEIRCLVIKRSLVQFSVLSWDFSLVENYSTACGFLNVYERRGHF